MKTLKNRNLSLKHHAFSYRVLLATAALIGLTPLAGLHAQINGTTSGTSVTMNIGDDTITTATIGIDYFTYCPWVPTAVSNDNFMARNFVFTGQGVASSIPNIASSDFTVSNYAPWVGNSNGTSNNIVGPDGQNYNRSVNNQEPAAPISSFPISQRRRPIPPTSISCRFTS